MRITEIEPIKGRRYRIYLNDAPAFVLYQKEINEYGLCEGEELSDELKKQIISVVLLRRAKLRCLHILEKMDKTEWQLRQKLMEGEYPAAVIDEAVAYVKSFHYVDDLRYASSYIADHQSSRSNKQLRLDLLKRGISDTIINEAFGTADQQDQKVLIRHWIEKKRFDKGSASPDELRRFIQFLMRKGFVYSDIRDVLSVSFDGEEGF